MPTSKQSRRSVADIAYNELKDKIIKCEFTPGQPIVEDELTSDLEVSRTPLREALKRLELEELVIRASNGRLRVTAISEKEVRELFTVRSHLESIIISEAIDNINEEEIKHLSYLVRMVKMTSRIEDVEEVNFFGSEFHNFLYSISKNNTVTKILRQLNDRITRYRRLAYIHITDTKKSSDEHEVILDFIIKKDKKKAELTIRKHVLDSMEQALKAVRQYKKITGI
ncbi:GntR family transcriptional regulator [Virgibacillus dakarensis]|uniref:GntR family transcriptional regulator n=1 Tax=Virgibacillus dakarensis TaxID=1917889 RepID=UPI000B43A1B1|nr:GntR family transcriptional regulator [Virgibacillus dakarensis]